MARSRIDRSLIRDYPELKELVETKEEEDLYLSVQDEQKEMNGFSSLDDPDSIPAPKDSLDEP